ncbi:MAG: radical SAM protein [Micromonosporaceae bacterium]|nr:radical SAM protein [Micromonosporaceae bacterium]
MKRDSADPVSAHGRPAATADGDRVSGLIADVFHTLVTQPTTLCNLDCAYCYLPDRKRQRLMTADVAAALAGSVAEQDSPYPVEVVWHCGEPLATPIGHMRSLLTAFEPLRRKGAITHGVQTNATLLNDAWCELLTEYGFHVGVSIDGPAACNAARVDWAGRPSHERIMRGVARLRDAGIPFTVICVVTPDTIGRAAELVRYFTDLGCASVGFNLEEQEGANAFRAPISVEQSEAFWRDLWRLRQAGARLPIRDLDRLCDWIGATRAGGVDQRPFDPIPTVSHDGDVVILSPELLGVRSPDYDFVIGNVRRQSIPAMLARAGRMRYVREFGQALRGCADTCEFYDFCQGAQAGNRYFETGSFTVSETAYCRNTRQALARAAIACLTQQAPERR